MAITHSTSATESAVMQLLLAEHPTLLSREEIRPQPVSVRIRKTDGKIQEERTYPRSADPRKSKG